jgi:hypothetical protein
MTTLLLWLALQAPPVKVTTDVSQVPDLAGWAAKAKTLVEEWHPKAAALLATPGFTPPGELTLVFEKDKKGVADASGTTIRIAADWIRKHPDDWGMVVHEMTHVIQSYPGGTPGWVTEGIADWVRYVKYENQPIPPKGRRGKSYKEAYRTAAQFLAWIAARKDPGIVEALNAAARGKTWRDAIFRERTGQELDALWADYLEDR